MAPLFLGLDSSTQALKASLLSSDLGVQAEVEVRFDRDLPHYGTKGGTLNGPSGSGIIFSPVMIVVEAMDLLFSRIKSAKWPVQDIRGVSAAGQQHASVYWSTQASQILSSLNAEASLTSQLPQAFSRAEIPNWQDSSTLVECQKLEEALGGPAKLADITGSRAHTRFTGPQIMRFMVDEPENYKQTSRISLVSSFVTTLLCLDGEIKGIDESDACGMNMWDMSTPGRGWSMAVLEAIAGKDGSKALERQLGKVESDGGKVVGKIGQYYVQRYGFSPECVVCPGTGDNPATFLSFSLREREGLVSLGTSDTVLVSTSLYNPDPEYHAFFHPAQIVPPTDQERQDAQAKVGGSSVSTDIPMRYFNMLVYKNGSLARENIRDQYFGSSWDAFNSAVDACRPKSTSDLPTNFCYLWFKPEIIPANAHGVHKYNASNGKSATEAKTVDEFANKDSMAAAVLESQMLNYRSRAGAIVSRDDGDAKLERVFATGGAAANATICSVMADAMGCNVCKPVRYDVEAEQWRNADWNACSVAAAYKAAWSWARHSATDSSRKGVDFDTFVQECSEARRQKRLAKSIQEENSAGDLELLEEGVAVVARPDAQRAQAYTDSLPMWKALEARALQECMAK